MLLKCRLQDTLCPQAAGLRAASMGSPRCAKLPVLGQTEFALHSHRGGNGVGGRTERCRGLSVVTQEGGLCLVVSLWTVGWGDPVSPPPPSDVSTPWELLSSVGWCPRPPEQPLRIKINHPLLFSCCANRGGDQPGGAADGVGAGRWGLGLRVGWEVEDDGGEEV